MKKILIEYIKSIDFSGASQQSVYKFFKKISPDGSIGVSIFNQST